MSASLCSSIYICRWNIHMTTMANLFPDKYNSQTIPDIFNRLVALDNIRVNLFFSNPDWSVDKQKLVVE